MSVSATDSTNSAHSAFMPTREIRDKRIAIARDVIAQVRHPVSPLRMRPGLYFYIRDDDAIWDSIRLLPDDADLGGVSDLIRPHCNVCLLGACFLSKARVYDETPVKDFMVNGFGGIPYSKFAPVLREIFGHDMASIETAFEDSGGWGEEFHFTDYWPDPRDRAVAIMENVIMNDGMFIPSKSFPDQTTSPANMES